MAAQHLQARDWHLPSCLCKLLQVSAYGDALPTSIRQANLNSLQASLNRDELWLEVAMLQRLVYKNHSQHRASHFMQKIREITRAMKTIRDLNLPEILSDLDEMILVSNSADKPAPNSRTSEGGGISSKMPGGNRARDSVRRTHRLPPQNACSYAMSKLILGCSMLQGIPGLIVAAADPLAAQIASSFFMPLCITAMAMLARIKTMATQMMLDCIKSYNGLSSILALLPSSSNNPGGGETASGAVIMDDARKHGEREANLTASALVQMGISLPSGAHYRPDRSICDVLDVLPQMLTCQWVQDRTSPQPSSAAAAGSDMWPAKPDIRRLAPRTATLSSRQNARQWKARHAGALFSPSDPTSQLPLCQLTLAARASPVVSAVWPSSLVKQSLDDPTVISATWRALSAKLWEDLGLMQGLEEVCLVVPADVAGSGKSKCQASSSGGKSDFQPQISKVPLVRADAVVVGLIDDMDGRVVRNMPMEAEEQHNQLHPKVISNQADRSILLSSEVADVSARHRPSIPNNRAGLIGASAKPAAARSFFSMMGGCSYGAPSLSVRSSISQPAARLAVFEDRKAVKAVASPINAAGNNKALNRGASGPRLSQEAASKGGIGLLRLDDLLGGMPTLMKATDVRQDDQKQGATTTREHISMLGPSATDDASMLSSEQSQRLKNLQQSQHHLVAVPVYDTSRSFSLGLGGDGDAVAAPDCPAKGAVASAGVSVRASDVEGRVKRSGSDHLVSASSGKKLKAGAPTGVVDINLNQAKANLQCVPKVSAQSSPLTLEDSSKEVTRQSSKEVTRRSADEDSSKVARLQVTRVQSRPVETPPLEPPTSLKPLLLASPAGRRGKNAEPTFVRVGPPKPQVLPLSNNATSSKDSKIGSAVASDVPGGARPSASTCGSLAESLDDIMGMLLGSGS